MKKRRLTGALLAGVMAAALTVPAMAVDITIDGSASQYEAYRLLNLSTSLKPDSDEIHNSHDPGEHTADCYNYAYTVNPKYTEAMGAALPQDSADADNGGFNSWDTDKSGSASGNEIIQYLAGLEDKGEDIRVYADTLYGELKGRSIGADAIDSDKTFTSMEQGYYLIAEVTTSADPDSRSLVMLDTAGQSDITVASKEGVPVLTKQVREMNDSTGSSALQDGADMDIGDDVSFVLRGNFPSNISAYSSYRYVIHDTLADGFALDAESIEVTFGGVELARDTDYTVVTDGHCDLEIQISDAVALAASKLPGQKLTPDTVVNVEYQAELLAGADLGNPGNANTAYLEFSNDPYESGSTSNTVPDKVNVFTYSLTVNKTDSSGSPLPGAGFVLQKFNGSTYVDYDVTSGVKGDNKTQFVFTGLDSGRYKLVETDVPAGYNKAADIEFEITGTYPTSSDDAQLTALSVSDLEGEPMSAFSTSYEDGTIQVAIENSTGIQLPSTGGAGLYLVYGIGAVVVIGGVVLFMPKKKKNEDQ